MENYNINLKYRKRMTQILGKLADLKHKLFGKKHKLELMS